MPSFGIKALGVPSSSPIYIVKYITLCYNKEVRIVRYSKMKEKIMDGRKNQAAKRLLQELQMLRRGQGVEGALSPKMQVLRLLLGVDQQVFKKNLVSFIDRFVCDERWKECLIVAFNADGIESSDDLTFRRQEAASMHEASIRTVTRWENAAIELLAEGLAHEFSEVLDEFYDSSPTLCQSPSEIIDELIGEIALMQSRLAKMKLLLGQLK